MTGYLCDVNVWIALAISGHSHHGAARVWLDGVDARASIFFCRATQQAFLRLLTNPAVLMPFGDSPLSNDRAWAAYEALLADDRIVFADEPAGLEGLWRELGSSRRASHRLWADAYLAAFATAGEFRLVTTDGGFRQFNGLDLLLLGDTTDSPSPRTRLA